VYRGVDRALVHSSLKTSSYYHGVDALGDAPDQNAPDLGLIQSESAVVALMKLVNKYPG